MFATAYTRIPVGFSRVEELDADFLKRTPKQVSVYEAQPFDRFFPFGRSHPKGRQFLFLLR
jgi:hypothetical protein